MTRTANVVVSARQNGPVMGQRGVVAHQAHRVRIGLGTVGIFFHRDGGGWRGVGLSLGGVGRSLLPVFRIVPNYRCAGTTASAATAATAVSAPTTAGHACTLIVDLSVKGQQLVLCVGGRSSSPGRSFCAMNAGGRTALAASFLPAALSCNISFRLDYACPLLC